MAQGHARMSHSLSAISVIRFVNFKLCASVCVCVGGGEGGGCRAQTPVLRLWLPPPVFELSIIVFSDKSVVPSRRSFKCAGKWQTGYKRRSGRSIRLALWKFTAAFVAQWKFNSNWQSLERNLIFTFKLAKQPVVLQLTVDCQETAHEKRETRWGERGRTLVYPL